MTNSGQFYYACTTDEFGDGFTAIHTAPYFTDSPWGRCVRVYVEE